MPSQRSSAARPLRNQFFLLHIAESIGKRPALVPGFAAGAIAIQGLPINPNTGQIDAGGAGVGFGLGGIVGGFLLVMSMLVLRSSLQVFQRTSDGLKGQSSCNPLLSTTIVGLAEAAHENETKTPLCLVVT